MFFSRGSTALTRIGSQSNFRIDSNRLLQLSSNGFRWFHKQSIQNFFLLNNAIHGKAYFTFAIVPKRYYARRTTRLKQEDQTTTTTGTSLEERKPGTMYGDQPTAGEEEETTENSLTPAIKNHLYKVYGTLTAGLGFTAVSTIVGLFIPGLSIIGFIGSLVGIIVMVFTDKNRVVYRQNLFLAVCAFTGLAIAPLVGASSLGVIIAAALGTSGIFGAFTLAALKARRKSMLMLGGVLGGGLLVVFLCGVAHLLLPLFGVTNPALLGALFNINLYLGLGIFSLFIAYDTQQLIENYRAGDTDHISPALNLFLNIINIFVRLLHIFGRD